MAKEKDAPVLEGDGAKWLTEDPAFKAAVAAGVAEQLAGIRAEIAAMTKPQTDGALPVDAMSLIQSLALQIAQIGHQNERDKPVAPAVLAARKKAHEKMMDAIEEVRKLPKNHPDRPKYRCTSKVVLSDTEISPWRRDPVRKLAVPVEFRWSGEPNDAMVPLNESAKKIWGLFRESRGNKTEYEQEVRNSIWLSDGGLVIEGVGRPIPKRREVTLPEPEPGELVVDDDPYNPNLKEVHVLGTLHDPAIQHYEGKVP